jgi:micrococcal nuclease
VIKPTGLEVHVRQPTDATATTSPPARKPRPRRAATIAAIAAIAALLLAACTASVDSVPAGAVRPSPTPNAATPGTASVQTPRLSPASPASTPVPLGAAPIGPTEEALVLRVVDGDTIEVDRGHGAETVRYIGIDTPETVHPSKPVDWMGAEASAANEGLVGGQTVVLERDVSETDAFGRLLRYVWVADGGDWSLVNLVLVADGFAKVATYPPDVRYADIYLAAQGHAREQGLGLWGTPPTPAPTPKPTAKPVPKPSTCHPSYEGACLKIGAGDYDCAGGSGNGPNYVQGRIRVVGPDEFDLDRNNDGVGCE